MLKIYRASAGSGKTYRLTQDYIHLLFNPQSERTHRRILAVTFTNKATDEMKSRILKELHALAQGEDSGYRAGLMQAYKMSEAAVNERARKVLIEILHDYSAFSISTIDKFFQQVIRAFARDIGVNGAYSLELDNDQTLAQAVDNLFLDLSKTENKQLLKWLTELAEERVEQSENWKLKKDIIELGKEIFKENYQAKSIEISEKMHDRDFLNNFRKNLRTIKTDFEQKISEKATQALQIISANGLTTEDFKGGTRSAMKTLEKLQKGEYKASNTFFSLANEVENCYAGKTPKTIIANIETAYYNGLQGCLIAICDLLTTEIVLYNSAEIVLKHLNTLGVLSDLALQIKLLTDEQNTMLISDTNMFLHKIIDKSETPFIYERTGVYVNHFMIDEFQDTSTLQWKNFKPLLANSLDAGNSNLVVGDVKQSIYRWRNSDWNLLDEQILKDFRDDQLDEENLYTNWRSDKNIIDFNNSFFAQASELLQAKLNESMPDYESLQTLRNKITHAYENLFQKSSSKAGEGRVELIFIDEDEHEDGWKDESLNRLPQLLEDLQERGYAPSDIALLVRTNDEERAVIQYLLNYKTTPEARTGYCYDIMGNEGLLVSSAASVRFLIGVLSLYINSEDKIQQAVVNYEYLRGKGGKTEEEALNLAFSQTETAEGQLSSLFSEAENERLAKIRSHSLFDMVEQIIALFGVGDWHKEAVFVQTFQDIVLRFSVGKTADLNSFLNWWNIGSSSFYVPSPENQQAFRIMTIHKSKGLDFPVVILPFCDWELEKSSSGYRKNILWCTPKIAPFDEFPLLPIEYSSKLSQSVFAENYFDEQMHQYIDNLNLVYVAFTRAKHELICFAPQKEVGELAKMKTLASLLAKHESANVGAKDFSPESASVGAKHFSPEGTNVGATLLSEAKDFSPEKINSYPTIDSSDRLKIRRQSLDFKINHQNLADSRLKYGTIMHRILQEIHTKADQERVIQDFIQSGFISQTDSEIIRLELEKFWNIPQVADWFAPDLRVLNEATILCPQTAAYRPDRVVIRGNRATVIDYKFGDSESKSQLAQVRRYMDLIAEMQYETRGFVCYVSLAKVVEC